MSKGMCVTEACRVFGAARSSVQEWKKRYLVGGMKALCAKKRGRKLGANRTLDELQESKLKRMVVDKTPDQLKLPFMLWERRAVAQLIEKQFGIKMPVRTVGEYLARWGVTYQRPTTRFYERKPKEVKKWLEETYPAVKDRAQAEGAEIQWADEAGVSTSSGAAARGYSRKGRTPELKRLARPVRINHITSVTNQGKMRFMLYKGTFTAELFIKFLGQTVRAAKGRKVIMIVDNLRVHKSTAVQQWLEGKEELIELQYLPAYSPDLNPDEYLNNDVKANVHRRGMPRNGKDLERNVRDHLRKISKSKSRVKSYFQAKPIRYAA